MWRFQEGWQTNGVNTGGGKSWVWNLCTMILKLCLILMYHKVEPERDKGLINWVGGNFLRSEEKYLFKSGKQNNIITVSQVLFPL